MISLFWHINAEINQILSFFVIVDWHTEKIEYQTSIEPFFNCLCVYLIIQVLEIRLGSRIRDMEA